MLKSITDSFLISYSLFLLTSCSVSNQISKSAGKILFKDSALINAHIGISIYEPASGKTWFSHNGEKYFIPASNVKLFTLYAGMKFLGDSLPGIKYYEAHDTLFVIPTGDPTFDHPSFKTNPVKEFLKKKNLPVAISDQNWDTERFGQGWAWNDYEYTFMPERSPFPVRGNIAGIKYTRHGNLKDSANVIEFDPPLIQESVQYKRNDSLNTPFIKRQFDENNFEIFYPDKGFIFQKEIPFVSHGLKTAIGVLKGESVVIDSTFRPGNSKSFATLHSQPSDSMFKLMMYNSDNFFAEQTLLMVSNERFGRMNEITLIDSLLSNELRDIPQLPHWVDGCGLSRYNLFTPEDFVYVIQKMKNEFGIRRLTAILPTGGQGTLSGYFRSDSSYVYGKTGTLSNCTALSGFLTTNSNKLVIFSILVNNFTGKAAPVRQAFEKFLQNIRRKY